MATGLKAPRPRASDLKELPISVDTLYALRECKDGVEFRCLDLYTVRLARVSDGGFASHDDEYESTVPQHTRFFIAMVGAEGTDA